MRIIGIDPGSLALGLGIIDVQPNRFVYVTAQTVKMSPKQSLPQRLLYLFDILKDVLQTYQPEVAAVENLFHGPNTQSAFTLGQCRGVVLLSMAQAGLPIFEYSPTSIKQAVTGSGRADKQQVRHMVTMLLGLQHKQHLAAQKILQCSLDSSDALAVALCQAQTMPFTQAMQQISQNTSLKPAKTLSLKNRIP